MDVSGRLRCPSESRLATPSSKAEAIDPKSPLPLARMTEVNMLQFEVSQGREWLDRSAAFIAKAQSINLDSYLVLYLAGGIKQMRGHYE